MAKKRGSVRTTSSDSEKTLVKIDTGVPGLNDILYGGLPAGQMYLLEGDPGTGKTTLAMQFIIAGVQQGLTGLYITLSETRTELENSALSHGWNVEELPIAEFVPSEASLNPEQQYTVFHPSEVELADTILKLTQLINKVKPDRIVIDSLSELRLLAADTMRYRRQLLALKHFFAGQAATVLLLDDRTAEGSDMQLQSIAHGVIRLEKLHRSYGATRRRLEIIKLRGSAYREGYHDYTIRLGGIQVYPRLVANEHMDGFTGQRISSNLEALDAMFGGGVNRGSATLLIGPSGSGKSSLAMAFAYAAAQRGDRAILYIFDEVLRTAQNRAEGLGMAVRRQIETGTLRMTQVDPAALSPGEFAAQIRSDVEENDTRLVVIDSLNGFMMAMPGENDLSVHLHELLSYLNQKGVVTFLIHTQHGLIGNMETEVDVSYLSDTVVLLRYFEAHGEIRQLLSVVKQRIGRHERTLRELRMRPGAIEIGAPLVNFHGVLSGIPEAADSAELSPIQMD